MIRDRAGSNLSNTAIPVDKFNSERWSLLIIHLINFSR